MKIVTFTRDLGETVQALTEKEFEASGLPDDWDEYVWQDQPTKEAAIARHDHAHGAWQDDCDAGRTTKDAY